MVKTVLELDLAGYSDIARQLEENLDVRTVSQLNDQIQGFVSAGLAAIKVDREEVVVATTGDGAILVFDRAEDAHRFAQATHDAAREHNATRNTASTKRWFRMGAATGELDVREVEGRRQIAGVTIANAVRLESAARVGELVIDLATYNCLPEEFRRLYGEVEIVRGKRDETFHACRCAMIRGEEGANPKPIGTIHLNRRAIHWPTPTGQCSTRFWVCGTSLREIAEHKVLHILQSRGVKDIRVLLPATAEGSASRTQLRAYDLAPFHPTDPQITAAERSYEQLESQVKELWRKVGDYLRRYNGIMYANITVIDDAAFVAFYDATGVGDDNITVEFSKVQSPGGYEKAVAMFNQIWQASQPQSRSAPKQSRRQV